MYNKRFKNECAVIKHVNIWARVKSYRVLLRLTKILLTIHTSLDKMTEESWNVESAIPQQLLEQIEFLRQSPSLQADSANPLVNMFAFLHIVRQLKVTRRTGWVDFNVANPGM